MAAFTGLSLIYGLFKILILCLFDLLYNISDPVSYAMLCSKIKIWWDLVEKLLLVKFRYLIILVIVRVVLHSRSHT